MEEWATSSLSCKTNPLVTGFMLGRRLWLHPNLYSQTESFFSLLSFCANFITIFKRL